MERAGERTFQPVRRFAPETSYEDFYPTYDWAQDSDGHILLVEIPGFTKEDVAVQLDNFGNLTVGGQRRLSATRYRRFKQVFGVPEDVNYETISARFDSGILYIILPKNLPANKEEERDGGKGRSKEEQEQEDKSQIPEERKGVGEGAGGQERAKEETGEKVGGEEERKEENRKIMKTEAEQRGEKRDKVGDEDQRKVENRDRIEEEVVERQENKEQFGEKRQAKRKKRVKFGGEARSGMIDGEAAKRDKTGREGAEAKEEKREKIGGQMGVKDRTAVGGGGEREVTQRGAEERGRESSDTDSLGVANGRRNRVNAEASTDTRDNGAVNKGMGLRRMWESAGWRLALASDTVGEIVQSMKKNKVAVASSLIALSAGLYLSQRLKTPGD